MSGSQILLIISGALIAWFFIRKFINGRSVYQYTPAEAEEKIKNNLNIVFLDVRTKQERKTGQIRGSIHLPLHELRTKIKELDRYKGSEIICYCRGGNRSLSAASILRKHGFNSSSLRGGISSWNLYKTK